MSAVRPGTHADRSAVAGVILSRVGFHTTRAVVENRVAQMVNRSRRRPDGHRLLVAGGAGKVEGFLYAERSERFELLVEDPLWLVHYVAARPGPRAGAVYVALLRAMREAAGGVPMLVGAWTHRALQRGRGRERLGRIYRRLGMREVAAAWEW